MSAPRRFSLRLCSMRLRRARLRASLILSALLVSVFTLVAVGRSLKPAATTTSASAPLKATRDASSLPFLRIASFTRTDEKGNRTVAFCSPAVASANILRVTCIGRPGPGAATLHLRDLDVHCAVRNHTGHKIDGWMVVYLACALPRDLGVPRQAALALDGSRSAIDIEARAGSDDGVMLCGGAVHSVADPTLILEHVWHHERLGVRDSVLFVSDWVRDELERSGVAQQLAGTTTLVSTERYLRAVLKHPPQHARPRPCKPHVQLLFEDGVQHRMRPLQLLTLNHCGERAHASGRAMLNLDLDEYLFARDGRIESCMLSNATTSIFLSYPFATIRLPAVQTASPAMAAMPCRAPVYDGVLSRTDWTDFRGMGGISGRTKYITRASPRTFFFHIHNVRGVSRSAVVVDRRVCRIAHFNGILSARSSCTLDSCAEVDFKLFSSRRSPGRGRVAAVTDYSLAEQYGVAPVEGL